MDMADFWSGTLAWLNGWKYILRRRQMMVVAAIPFLLSLISAVLAIWLIWIYYPLLMNSLVMSWLGSIESIWLAILIKPLIWIGGLVVTLVILYAVYVLHAIVAQPFYSLLAEQALKLEGREASRESRFWQMLKVSLLKGLIFLVAGVALFVFSFVPVLNLVAVMATLLLLAFDCMDYSLEARRLGLRQRFRYVFNNKAQWAGMAMGLALTLLLPGLTLLVIPGAVVGAALILKETNESRTPAP